MPRWPHTLRLEERTCPQQRVFPAHPEAPAADLAVGKSAAMVAEDLADGRNDFRNGVEPDTSDEVNLPWHHFVSLSWITPLPCQSRFPLPGAEYRAGGVAALVGGEVSRLPVLLANL